MTDLQCSEEATWLMAMACSEFTRISGNTEIATHCQLSLCRSAVIILGMSTKQCAFRFHAQRFYAIECLATKEPNATHIKTDMTLNMMLITMPVANAVEFYRNVQVICLCIHC